MLFHRPEKDTIYYVTFEEYLQPKKPLKKTALQLVAVNEKLLQAKKNKIVPEDHVIKLKTATKWQNIYRKVREYKEAQHKELKNKAKTLEESSSKERATEGRSNLGLFANLASLPSFLAFLRARNDDGMCKRKTGFEIYCEMASFHGFVNFVGATTLQRVFWFLVICVAIIITIIVLVMSHLMNIDTPTIVNTESTTYPAWNIPFPAITLCNFNAISKRKAEALAVEMLAHSNISKAEMVRYFQLAVYNSQQLNFTQKDYEKLETLLLNSNYTLAKLLHEISPDCLEQLVRCKWRGRIQSCETLFTPINALEGSCCTFNYYALKDPKMNNIAPEHIYNYGRKAGLTLLLDPQVQDYTASYFKLAGFQVLIHDAFDFPDAAVEHRFVYARTESTISIEAKSTYATDYVRGERLQRRRCYFAQERKLHTFRQYTQNNCLAECRSEMILKQCGCVPPYWPHLPQWRVCGALDSACLLRGRGNYTEVLTEKNGLALYKINRYAENFICNCFPSCEFNQYRGVLDYGTLERNFLRGDQRLFKNVTVENHTLLHIFYGDATSERLRIDVYENWLSYIGTFGGVAGLYMGYSAVSLFEMIFFVFVRPACNWLTKKQIRYRIKRRQRKAAETKTRKEREERERRENSRVI